MTPWPHGVRVETFETIDSTNAECLRRVEAGDVGPLWISASRQTDGRARRGRGWQSPKGNFSASYLSAPLGGLQVAPLRSFCAALALYDAIEAASGTTKRLALKWPNDVVLDGKKLAGILLESAKSRQGEVLLVIGIGVNLMHVPPASELEPGALEPVSLRGALGRVITPDMFLGELAFAYDRWDKCLEQEGFEEIRRAWLGRATRLGEIITARLPGRVVEGVFETIDQSGAIVIGTENGCVTLPAAEIHFPDGIKGSEARHVTGN